MKQKNTKEAMLFRFRVSTFFKKIRILEFSLEKMNS